MNSYFTQTHRKTQQIILSVPVQASLLIALSALTLWTLYFSSYPAAHNTMHQGRHHTLGVACH